MAMPYAYRTASGRTYFLHGKPVTLRNGRRHIVYYFAAVPKPGQTLDAAPPGYRVQESPRTGVPYLRKQ
jgi:hypothetical protein